MPLAPGSRVGSYEVVAPIGAGGMGEVYRATDLKLDRSVALKVLPQLFTGDPERLARFEREAKVLAALNHPNIAQVYGFEANAIAMEFVDGETLDEIIRASAPESPGGTAGLPLDRALSIARQIAMALETAHDQGIVHRDLKPANVKVREDGTVKVLDFGLAKAFAADAESAASAVSNSPTLTARSTQLGMILGTAAYMAPEQAKGRAVDRRADVWAFGVVLFEMLAGRRAFEGDDVSEVLASVLKTEPEWAALPKDLPAPVMRLLRRCLEKDPKKRLRDVAEGMLQLDEGLATAHTEVRTSNAVVRTPAPLWRRLAPIAVTAVATAALVVGVEIWRRPAPVSAAPIRFQFEPPKAMYISGSSQDLTISPDGSTIVYSVTETAQPSLWIRRLDQIEPAALRGAERALNPVVSPDNASVAFVDVLELNTIKKVSMLGGPAQQIVRAKHGSIGGLTWTHDGSIVFGCSIGPLQIVPDGGGEPQDLTKLEATEALHAWPYEIPGTSIVLFTAGIGSLSPATGGQLAAIDRATGRTVRFKIPGFHPRYLPSGHMVYASPDGSLRALGFDPKTMTVSGNPAPVLEAVGIKASGAAEFDVSRDGRIVYGSGGISLTAARTLTWVDRTGKETPIPAPPRAYVYARLSPDGARLAMDVREQEQNVWIWDFARETLLRLTDKPGTFQYCLWTPDSRRIVFYSNSASAGSSDLYQTRADGTGTMDRVTDTSHEQLAPFPNAVTPDGKQIVFRASGGSAQNDLYLASLTGGVSYKKLLGTEHDERNATISPDGKWMAFESDLSGKYEVYVRPFPNVDAGQFPLSTGGGIKPEWSPTGKEIFYIGQDNAMMTVPVDTTKEFSAGKPVKLFDASPYYLAAVGRNYDVSADGKRFVFPKPPAAVNGRNQSITIVLNWADELRGRVK